MGMRGIIWLCAMFLITGPARAGELSGPIQ
jgi:hypothetical protein